MTPELETHRRELRDQLRERRRTLPAQQRIVAAERLATQLLSLPSAPRQGYVAGYWAMDGEIALHAWQLNLPPECVYCLPVLHEDGCLRFAPWRPGDGLVSNRYGIPEPDIAATSLLEPDAISLAVVPLVAFDKLGHRLGMGGGWYDRSFAFRQRTPGPPWLVGAAFDTQNVDSHDSDEPRSTGLIAAEWDVPLDAVCTESTTYFCKAFSS